MPGEYVITIPEPKKPAPVVEMELPPKAPSNISPPIGIKVPIEAVPSFSGTQEVPIASSTPDTKRADIRIPRARPISFDPVATANILAASLYELAAYRATQKAQAGIQELTIQIQETSEAINPVTIAPGTTNNLQVDSLMWLLNILAATTISEVSSTIPTDFFRDNFWIVRFQFPGDFKTWLASNFNKDLDGAFSDDILELKGGFNALVSPDAEETLLSFKVRSFHIPGRYLELQESTRYGYPISTDVPISWAFESFGTRLPITFREFSVMEGPQYSLPTLPASTFWKLYLDWISDQPYIGIKDETYDHPEQKEKPNAMRRPLLPINASILLTAFILRTSASGWFPSDSTGTVEELKRALQVCSPWVVKILAIPTTVNPLDINYNVSTGNPLETEVQLRPLFYFSGPLINPDVDKNLKALQNLSPLSIRELQTRKR